MPDQSFSEFVASFDRASLQPKLEMAEQQRQMILQKFPRERLGGLDIKDYADDRDDRSTLAWLLARGSPALGTFRGVAFKAVGIHRLKNTGLYRSSLKDAGEAESDWVKLREGLVRCCDLVMAGQWEAINKEPYALNIPSLRTKLLFIYFPADILPIYGSAEIMHFMEALKVPMAEGESKWSAMHNRRLLEHLRALPELQGWSTLEIVMLLREWHLMESEREPRVFKVAPGENAMFWNECLDQGVMILGWGNTGDLSHAKSYDDVRAVMAQTGYYKSQITISKKAREVWNFVSLKAGDIIAANRGTAQILALGTVVEPGYKYLSAPLVSDSHFRHVVHVEWDTSEAKTIPAQTDWAFVTVQELTGDLKRLVLNGSTAISSSPPALLTMPALNRILYGPPGTGKTHRIIRDAAAICAALGLADRDTKDAYDKACARGRVRLVTFHQSFSYEDFIEGIRPVMDEGVAARFEVRDGVFKEIATEALFACLEPLSVSNDIPFEEMQPIEQTTPNRPGPNTITGRVWDLADDLSTEDAPATRQTVTNAAIAEGINPHTAHTQYGHWRRAMGLARPRLKRALSKANTSVSKDVDSTKAAVADYLKLGAASGWQLRADKKYPPYVLVIDEINRGNISRIFGELITLIEDDKRHGASNALQVMLPSSRDPFTVPPNLFLLGTMNTADKSLALLDVALRRRFEFEELAPNFTICESMPAAMREVLMRINERIELRKDRDHRIGHAFFIGVSDAESFNHAFRRKVVPLLQEYFFNDIDGARFVLGEEGRKEGGFLRRLSAAVETRLQRNHWRWFTDEEPGMDCWEQLQINFGSADV